jgi:hypothetical protein
VDPPAPTVELVTVAPTVTVAAPVVETVEPVVSQLHAPKLPESPQMRWPVLPPAHAQVAMSPGLQSVAVALMTQSGSETMAPTAHAKSATYDRKLLISSLLVAIIRSN